MYMTITEYVQELEEIFRTQPDKTDMNRILEYTKAYAAGCVDERRKEERAGYGREACIRAGRDPDGIDSAVFLRIADRIEQKLRRGTGELEKAAVEEVLREQQDLTTFIGRIAESDPPGTYDLAADSSMSGYALRWEQNGNIREVKRALEQGRMHIFPCRPGETVYEVRDIAGGIRSYTVQDIVVSGFPKQSVKILCSDGQKAKGGQKAFSLKDFDRTVFTSRPVAREYFRFLQYEEDMHGNPLPDRAVPAAER